jgi:hypothetical protein
VRTRLLIAVPGVLAGLYGGWLLLSQGVDNLEATVVWAVGGVIVHDGILAPAVVVGCLVTARLMPPRLQAPALVGVIVLGTVTVVAIPVLGRFGAHSDNPTLLDRDYWAGWLVVAGLTLVGVLVTIVVGARSRRTTTRSGSGQGSRG